MNEYYRSLLYPLGFLAQFVFGLRFIVQWIATEKAKKMITPKLFWHLSIFGNSFLFIHSLIQLHFPMSIAQALNLIFSWRNLNLMGPEQKKVRFTFVLFLIGFALFSTITFFAAQTYNSSWISGPDSAPITSWVHVFGIVGIFCFALRFWVQWWQAENSKAKYSKTKYNKTNSLTDSFWWISVVGALICTVYFCIMQDWVNFIGPLLSIVPYSRNLYFAKRVNSYG